jgi:hypothetical protein
MKTVCESDFLWPFSLPATCSMPATCQPVDLLRKLPSCMLLYGTQLTCISFCFLNVSRIPAACMPHNCLPVYLSVCQVTSLPGSQLYPANVKKNFFYVALITTSSLPAGYISGEQFTSEEKPVGSLDRLASLLVRAPPYFYSCGRKLEYLQDRRVR